MWMGPGVGSNMSGVGLYPALRTMRTGLGPVTYNRYDFRRLPSLCIASESTCLDFDQKLTRGDAIVEEILSTLVSLENSLACPDLVSEGGDVIRAYLRSVVDQDPRIMLINSNTHSAIFVMFSIVIKVQLPLVLGFLSDYLPPEYAWCGLDLIATRNIDLLFVPLDKMHANVSEDCDSYESYQMNFMAAEDCFDSHPLTNYIFYLRESELRDGEYTEPELERVREYLVKKGIWYSADGYIAFVPDIEGICARLESLRE